MLNVFTGSRISRDIRPTTTVESMPPLRKAPSGTSLTSRFSTARVMRSRTPFTAAAYPIGRTSDARGNSMRQ
jgi:hypothetical protein